MNRENNYEIELCSENVKEIERPFTTTTTPKRRENKIIIII